jgi:hypothetical protein
LERLKEVRNSGNKRKYEIEELENVYDEVDEKEYSNTVLKRQQDDWIIDDGIKSFFMLFYINIGILFIIKQLKATCFKQTFCKKIDFATESILSKLNKELCKLNVN